MGYGDENQPSAGKRGVALREALGLGAAVPATDLDSRPDDGLLGIANRDCLMPIHGLDQRQKNTMHEIGSGTASHERSGTHGIAKFREEDS